MLPAALHLASLASLWAALQGTIGVSANTRVNARSAAAQFGQTSVGYDLDLGTTVGANLTESRFSLSLGYSPSLTLRDVNSAQRTTLVMHGGFLGLNYGGRGYTLALSQAFSVGTTSFRGLRTTPLDPAAVPDPMASRVDLLPGVETARVFNSTTRASFSYQWHPRVNSSLGAGYNISGGSGGATQMVYPQMRTASADLTSGYTISGYDTIGANLSFSQINTSGGLQVLPNMPPTASPDYRYYTLTLLGTWNHRFGSTTSGSLGAGLAGYKSTTPGFTPFYSLSLAGGGSFDAELLRGPGYALTTGVGVGVGPGVNMLVGTMQQRATGSGRLSLTIDNFALYANGDGSQTFPLDDPLATRLFGVGIGASYSPARLIDLSAEYRNTWQSSGPTSTPRLWVVYVAVSVRAPPIRF